MKWYYQVFLRQTTLTVEDVRKTLSVFPSIVRLNEEIVNSPIGKTRNIRAYVEVSGNGQMTEQEQAALHDLNLEMSVHYFSPHWETGELEAQREKDRMEAEARRKKYLEEKYPGRRYYLCYFRQQPALYSLNDDGPITVSFVHPDSYPPDQYELAQEQAKELENKRYEQKDFNLQIEARLAASIDDARAGTFLDD